MQSNEEFGYPVFNENGVMQLTRRKFLYPDMLMDITVCRLGGEDVGGQLDLESSDEEMAIVLIEGSCQFEIHDARYGGCWNIERKSCINDPGYCLHVCKGTSVLIIAYSTTEILIQSTQNDREFEPQFYTPSNTRRDTFGQGQFEGKAVRTVTTFFDYESAPYSNMVCGEILIPQGGWSSYPPHEHPQPEVYYYRFGHPAGFGACFIDDHAYMIKDRSFAAIPGGKYHPQVNAPGYPMMYVWMIRHFDGYPWTERNFKPEHQWLLEG